MNRLQGTSALVVLVLSAACANEQRHATVGEGIEVLSFRRDYAEAHVVRSGDAMFLFDAGLEREAEALEAELRAAGVDPAKLRAIVISHGHQDHVGGARHFREKFGTPIVVGAADARLLAAGVSDPLCPTDQTARDRQASDEAARFEPIVADVELSAETDLAKLTGIPGTIIPVPGHTEGSLVVAIPGALLVGDLLRGAIAGGGADVHFYMCDLEDNRRDVQSLLGAFPEANAWFPGHFGSLTRADVVKKFGESQ